MLTTSSLHSIFSWLGILALLQSIVNRATIGPIVFFVGLQINEEALNFMPSRHYAAYIIGLFPSIYDWVVNVAGRSSLQGFSGFGSFNTAFPSGLEGWIGVLAWKRGALLVSLVWVAMVVMVLDRKWVLAFVWAIVAALFAVVGIIHVPEAGFKSFADPVWEQCEGAANDLGEIVSVTCWEHAEQWMFFVAYIMLAATFGVIYTISKFDETIGDEIDDPSAHAFDDWFKDAAKGAEGYEEDEEVKPVDDPVSSEEDDAPKE